SGEWRAGLLAGLFDAGERQPSDTARPLAGEPPVRFGTPDKKLVDWVVECLAALGFAAVVEHDARSGEPRCVRMLGGLRERLRFLHTTDPAATGRRALSGQPVTSAAALRVASVEPLGIELPMFDLTTGTGDF